MKYETDFNNSFIHFITWFLSVANLKKKRLNQHPKQGDTYVLPPQQEQPQQTIQKQENIDPKVAAEIIAVIRENIAATQAKDKERVLKTIHKDCPQLRSTIQGMDYVFANFDMVFDLEKIEVIELSGEDAKGILYADYKSNSRARISTNPCNWYSFNEKRKW